MKGQSPRKTTAVEEVGGVQSIGLHVLTGLLLLPASSSCSAILPPQQLSSLEEVMLKMLSVLGRLLQPLEPLL